MQANLPQSYSGIMAGRFNLDVSEKYIRFHAIARCPFASGIEKKEFFADES